MQIDDKAVAYLLRRTIDQVTELDFIADLLTDEQIVELAQVAVLTTLANKWQPPKN